MPTRFCPDESTDPEIGPDPCPPFPRAFWAGDADAISPAPAPDNLACKPESDSEAAYEDARRIFSADELTCTREREEREQHAGRETTSARGLGVIDHAASATECSSAKQKKEEKERGKGNDLTKSRRAFLTSGNCSASS
eukprot:242673-Rhodomonas_salina.2